MSAPIDGARGPGATGTATQDQTSARTDSIDQRSDVQRKADATRIARAALAGIELARLADGSWIASRWGLLKPLAEHEVDDWLGRVGARA